MKKLFPLCGLAALLLFYGCASKPASTPLAERAAQEAGAGQRKQQGLTSESQREKKGPSPKKTSRRRTRSGGGAPRRKRR